MNEKIIENSQAYEVYTSRKELEKIQKELREEMLVNSTVKKLENGNSSAQQISIDISSLNFEDFQDCIAISTEIEHQEQLNKSHRRLNNPTPMESTMTYEELYECSMESDSYVQEDENLFGLRLITDLNGSQSIENVMQYFDENVNAYSGSSRSVTPTKSPCPATAAVQVCDSFGSPPPPYQEFASPESCCEKAESELPTSSTKELRKIYEQLVGSKDQRKSASPLLPTTTTPNHSRPSKVKQLAQMFNSRISQLMGHGSTEKKDSNSSIASQKPSRKPAVMKPEPKVCSSLPTSNPSLPSPVPSPRFERKPIKAVPPQSSSDSENACIFPEDVFCQLSVKDKVLLYNQFFQDKSNRQSKVCEYPGMNRRTSPTSTLVATVATIHSLQEADSEDFESDEEVKVEELHTNKLTVVLKPSPERGGCLPKQAALPHPLPRKAKLESVESRGMRRGSIGGKNIDKALKIINDTREQHDTNKGVIEVELPISQLDTSVDEEIPEAPSNRVQRKVKRQAPQPPKAINETPAQQDTNKGVIEVDLPMGQVGTSVDEKIPEAPSNRVQRKLKRPAPQPPTTINETPTQQDTNEGVTEVDLPIGQVGTSIEEKLPQQPSKRGQRKVKRQAPQPPTTIKRKQPDTNEGVEIELPNNITDAPTDHIIIQIDEAVNAQRLTIAPTTDGPQSQEQDLPSVTSYNQNSEADYESASSSSSKFDQPQTEQTASQENKTLGTELNELSNQLPKKRLRRPLTWSNDNCIIKSQPIPPSTDPYEVINANNGQDTKKSLIANQKIYDDINQMAKYAQKAFKVVQQKANMDESILNNMNSTESIKGGYQLTALSTPSTTPYTGSPSPSTPEVVGKSGMGQTFLPSPSNEPEQMKTKSTPLKLRNLKIKEMKQPSKEITSPEGTLQSTIDSFIDHGFETGSNDRESPHRADEKLFVKLTPEVDKSRRQNPVTFSSTPAKGLQNQPRQIFSNNTTHRLRRQSISPICPVNGGPPQRLWHTKNSRYYSPAMPVIWNDRPWEPAELWKAPYSRSSTESGFLGTTSNSNMTNNTERQEKSSMFWVRAVNTTISLEIFYNPSTRLNLLHQIFSQKSCENRDLNFGIDDYKFSIRKSIEKTNISTRLTPVKGCSHYWFSTGDFAMPFRGKRLGSRKIRRFFNFIKDLMTANTQLSFGVDDYEFSRMPEYQDRFSIREYSMTYALYDDYNGMEKCNSANWPVPPYVTADLSSSKAHNLSFSENDSKIDPQNTHQMSDSSCGTKYYDVASENSRDMALSRTSKETANDSFHEKFDFEKFFADDAESLDAKMDETHLKLMISEIIKKLQKLSIDLENQFGFEKTHANMIA
ncbi:nucleolar protein dao-5-like [Anastrepha ludens]|uniref:nucleolar protein dao-5-like n=1 Tax=Anastrepha ludens TaxID=28586 RepID=UPI0023B030A9|nr:nucleolar protein dao-5-like [Anastrepha ludens]